MKSSWWWLPTKARGKSPWNQANFVNFGKKKVFAGRTLIPVPIFWEQQVAWGKGKELWSKIWLLLPKTPVSL